MTLRRTALPVLLLVLCALTLAPVSQGQTETATLSGLITDPQGKVVPDVAVDVTNIDMNVTVHQSTNRAGIYVVAGLRPGRYRVTVKKDGFRRIDLTDLVLNVQDVLSRNFQLQLGPVMASITVIADNASINTESATVSTVIDRKFVESLPLNGRSFNTLFQLTPGVVIAPSSTDMPGQFSIAGQRTDANNFTIDGVSANFGVGAVTVAGQSGTGSSPAFSAFGGTSSLVSVDALQEFRVETSSFAPEFGRSPGGQVILTTRSGTNDLHGGVFDYFRNTIMDANDWFANQAGKPRAAEHHNDFGAFLGGPLWKSRTFYFASYEGSRLDLPQTTPVEVPSEYARTTASDQLAPYLNAYPRPDDRTITPGVYTAQFTGSYSNPASLDAGSVRIDHTFNQRFNIFGRYNYVPSQIAERSSGLSTIGTTTANTQTITAGINMFFNHGLANTLRGNVSTQNANKIYSLDSFGGAVPLNPSLLIGNLAGDNAYSFFLPLGASYLIMGQYARNRTRQLNFLDDLLLAVGRHQFKFGGDYRAINLDIHPAGSDALYIASSVESFVTTGQANLIANTVRLSQILSRSLSLYAQDSWKMTPRVTIMYGVRWELSPAPTARGATTLAAWTNVDNPSQIALAPIGTHLWSTTYGNFAPRIGLACSLDSKGNLVLRAGAGIFYDVGVGSSATLGAEFPNSAASFTPNVSLPVNQLSSYLPSISLQPPYPDGIYAFDPNLKMPRSYQWNLALEKSFRGTQAITMTYVGQKGRDLLRQEALYQPNTNFLGEFVLNRNDAASSYHALQLQYRKPLADRLQVLLNYSWSHSLDNASNDVITALSNTVVSAARDHASSDFDVRHSFSGAFTYQIPTATRSGIPALLTKDWALDFVIVARTGFPFNGVVLSTSPDPGGYATSRPDLVPGQRVWLYGAQCLAVDGPPCAGGKGLNPAAFAVPPTIRQGTEGRNDIAGFGLTQVDLSLSRKLRMGDRLALEFRADAFNVLNHPNFTNPQAYVEFGPFYLQSQNMLNQSLGGLNPLFQEGGPRSLQISLKLTF